MPDADSGVGDTAAAAVAVVAAVGASSFVGVAAAEEDRHAAVVAVQAEAPSRVFLLHSTLFCES
jgi:hypothetical protein